MVHLKNIFFTFITISIVTSSIRCSQSKPSSPQRTVRFDIPQILPQDLLRIGLIQNDYRLVKNALTQQADPNKIIGRTPFGERTIFNDYLARSSIDYKIVALMLDNGANPTVETDRILDQKNRTPLIFFLKKLIAKQRQTLHREQFNEYLKTVAKQIPARVPCQTSQRHQDPTAL